MAAKDQSDRRFARNILTRMRKEKRPLHQNEDGSLKPTHFFRALPRNLVAGRQTRLTRNT